MPAPLITTDLTTIADAEPGTVGNWIALGGGQAGLAEETDFAVQGSTSISKQVKQETKGMHADYGSAITFTAPQHVYTWLYATTPGATDIRANGGLRVTFGSAATARREFYVNGKDNYRYGGWVCYPVWPFSTADNLIGTSGASRFFGGIMSNTVTVKGLNFGVDVIRFGTGIDATGGGAGFPDLTFDLISTENDLQANAWGVFQATASGAQLQGELRIGFDNFASVTTFADSDRVIINPDKNPSDVPNTKTRPIFTGISLRGNGTTATFTGCSFISLDTYDRGFIDCDTATNSANVTFDSCVFQDWGSIGLASTVTASACKFTKCAPLIVNGGDIDGCTFNECNPVQAGTGIENIQNCTFNALNSTSFAIITDVSAGTYSLVGNEFVGYNASNNTPTSAIRFTATTGTITINVSGGAIPSYSTAGATIVMQSSSTLTLNGLQPNTEVRVYDTGTTTEVGGVENSGTSEQFAIATSAVDIVLHNLQYLNQRLTNVDTSSDLNLPVQQTIDRQYENPAFTLTINSGAATGSTMEGQLGGYADATAMQNDGWTVDLEMTSLTTFGTNNKQVVTLPAAYRNMSVLANNIVGGAQDIPNTPADGEIEVCSENNIEWMDGSGTSGFGVIFGGRLDTEIQRAGHKDGISYAGRTWYVLRIEVRLGTTSSINHPFEWWLATDGSMRWVVGTPSGSGTLSLPSTRGHGFFRLTGDTLLTNAGWVGNSEEIEELGSYSATLPGFTTSGQYYFEVLV